MERFLPSGLLRARLFVALLTWGFTTSLGAREPKPLHTIEGHDGIVLGLNFSPDGKLLATGCVDKVARVWDVADARKKPALVAELKHPENVWAVCFDRTGKTLVCSTWKTQVYFWDAGKKKLLATVDEHKRPGVDVLVAHPKDDIVASAGRDGDIVLWNVTKGTVAARWKAHGGTGVRGLAYNPAGTVLASAGLDRAIGLWDATTGKNLATWRDAHPFGAYCVSFSPDGKLLASGGVDRATPTRDGKPDGEINLWDVAAGRVVAVLAGHEHSVFGVAFSPDGRLLASASRDKTVRLWDVATRKCVAVLGDHAGFVQRVAFSPDGKLLATSSSDKTVKLWAVPPKP